MLINGNCIENTSDICNEFNNYFINCAQFKYSGPLSNTHQVPNKAFEFSTVSIDRVSELPNKKSVGWDGLQVDVLKENGDILAPALVRIFNKIINSSSFPDKLKVQKVIPIHKSGCVLSVGNYRPIALLPIVNKCFEKILQEQITTFLNLHDILYKRQYGFRSADAALIDMVDTICLGLDSRKHVGGMFLDLRKAFDSINH